LWYSFDGVDAVLVKFASYNIQYGYGQDWRYDLDRIVDALAGQDVICLQEVTINWPICNRDNQPDLLAKKLNLYAAYAPGFEVDGSHCNADGVITNARMGFGNMVLSRWPILYSRSHSLPRPETVVPAEFHPNVDFPRVALETVIEINGRAIRVFSVHLSHLPGIQRQLQIDVLKDLVSSLPREAGLWEDDVRLNAWNGGKKAPEIPVSTMFFGDFNFEPQSADYASMIASPGDGEAGLIDCWTVSKHKSKIDQTCVENGGHLTRLDYMFTTYNYNEKIESVRVDQSVVASDHFPVFFEVHIEVDE
jgi:endonuclease/exonuclease/phosphatase family metal-dependent hydrolase